MGDKKELTEEELKPPPPPVYAGGLFGGGFGAFGGGSLFGGGYVAPPALPASSFGVSHFSFGAPVPFGGLKRVEKKKEYGVDYI